jgi:hypothetical protein
MSKFNQYLRKNSKAVFAVLAVLAIFLFVFASGTGQGYGDPDQRDQRRRASAPVASWDGGSLNEGELSLLTAQRMITNEFLIRLFAQGGGTQYDLPTVPDFTLRSSSRPYVAQQVIFSEVYSSLAEDAGITVSDDLINYFLEEWGLRRVDSNDVVGLLGSVGEGNVSQNQAIVFETLEKLLKSYFYQRGYFESERTLLPTQQWADWRKLNERIAVQAAIVPTSKFLDQVTPPNDQQLRELYAEYKDAEPNQFELVNNRELPVATPGFKAPRRIKLQYLQGDLTARMEKLLETVTEEEIADYYERNKRTEYVKTSFGDVEGLEDFENDAPLEGLNDLLDGAATEGEATQDAEPAAGTEGETTAQPATETPAADTPADTTPAEGAETEAAEPAATEAAPAEEASDSGATKAAEATDEAGDAETTPADEPAADEPAEDAPAAEDEQPAVTGGEQSATRARSPFQLVAFQQTDEDPADDAAAATEDDAPADDSAEATAETTESAEAAPADDNATESATADNATTETTPADGTAITEAAATGVATTDAATGEAATGDAEAATTTDTATGAAATDAPVQYIPLDDVRGEIRETLATTKAVEELRRNMGEARLKLQREYNGYGRQVIVNREAKKNPPAVPAKLKDLQWLADEYELNYVTTEPLTIREMAELEGVGRATDEQSGQIPVTYAAFMTLEPFEPFLAREAAFLSGDWYLAMKTEDVEAHTPPFEEVRDQVAAAWKQIEAAKIAEKTAGDLVKESEAATVSFEEFFRTKEFDVIPSSSQFSWLSFPLGMPGQEPPELSEIKELPNADDAFMAKAFALGDDETAVVMNHDRTSAFIFRLQQRQSTPDLLKQRFLAEAGQWAGYGLMMNLRFSENQNAVNDALAGEVAHFEYDEEWLERSRADAMAGN